MKIDYSELNGLVPAIIQDNTTNVVLMLGYRARNIFQPFKKQALDQG